MAAKRATSHGGRPTLATITGEPGPASSGGKVTGFGGAPTMQTHINRGSKQVGRSGAGSNPKPYGGAPALTSSRSTKGSSGSGQTTTSTGTTDV